MVKYVNLGSDENNLGTDELTIEGLNNLLHERGMVMVIHDDPAKTEVIPVSEYSDQELISKGIETGTIVASAPTGSPDSPWNEEQEESLDNAIEMLRKLRKVANDNE